MKDGRPSFGAKLAFGVGSAAESIALTSVAAYAMFYYNQVLGVSATLIGIATTAGLLVDAVADPLVGALSDRTRSRLGRRHPWMFAAPLPVGLCLFAIFAPPSGLSETGLFWWFTVSVLLLRQSMTLFHTPHLALGGEMSRDYAGRSEIMAYSSLAGFAGGAMRTWIALTFFFAATAAYPKGLLNPEAYPRYGLLVAGCAFVALLASAWFTRGVIPHLPQPPEDQPKFSAREFAIDLRRLFSNRNYLWLLIAYFFLSCMLGIRSGLELYVNTYFWGFTSEQLRWLLLATGLGYLSSFTLVPRLHRRFEKRATIMAGALLLVLSLTVPVGLALLGWFAKPGSDELLPLLIGFWTAEFFGIALLGTSVNSALADIADQNELAYGVRQEGVLYATRSFFAKIDVAIGALLAGLALDLMAFPKQAGGDVLPAGVWMSLGVVYSLGAMIPGLISLIFYGRYNITPERFAATQDELARRRLMSTVPPQEPTSASPSSSRAPRTIGAVRGSVESS